MEPVHTSQPQSKRLSLAILRGSSVRSPTAPPRPPGAMSSWLSQPAATTPPTPRPGSPAAKSPRGSSIWWPTTIISGCAWSARALISTAHQRPFGRPFGARTPDTVSSVGQTDGFSVASAARARPRRPSGGSRSNPMHSARRCARGSWPDAGRAKAAAIGSRRCLAAGCAGSGGSLLRAAVGAYRRAAARSAEISKAVGRQAILHNKIILAGDDRRRQRAVVAKC